MSVSAEAKEKAEELKEKANDHFKSEFHGEGTGNYTVQILNISLNK